MVKNLVVFPDYLLNKLGRKTSTINSNIRNVLENYQFSTDTLFW